MAKALNHSGSRIRGSIGGMTAQRHQNGSQIYSAKPNPTRMRSFLQNCSRNAFVRCNEFWNRGSHATKIAWEEHGIRYSLTGRELWFASFQKFEFMRLSHQNVVQFPIKSLPLPHPHLVPFFDLTFRDYGAAPFSRVRYFIDNNSDYDFAVFIESSMPYNRAKNFFDGKFDATNWRCYRINSGVQNASLVLPDLLSGRRYFIRISILYRSVSPSYNTPIVQTHDIP